MLMFTTSTLILLATLCSTFAIPITSPKTGKSASIDDGPKRSDDIARGFHSYKRVEPVEDGFHSWKRAVAVEDGFHSWKRSEDTTDGFHSWKRSLEDGDSK
ncbi:hypothetical protein EIP91_005987 [Steccherinum ochraceum]|uniref:Uncharacterized protein n=1 Tax=Steccherinum ochraceum TaxID=92696 RepID=A0A4R0RCD7_9APHY|nr:hypothetical protein EIP91_005987 [Steccherinum ochraceum]